MKTMSIFLTTVPFILVLVCFVLDSGQNETDHDELASEAEIATLTPEMNESFHYAIYDCETEDVRKFISMGIDLDFEFDINGGWSPLQRAAAGRDLNIVKLLVDGGATVDWVGDNNTTTPLHWAIEDGSADIANYLLDCGADPNLESDGWTALDSLYGHRFVGRLRTLPIASFMQLEDRLIELGTIENEDRSPEDKAHSRFSPASLQQQTD